MKNQDNHRTLQVLLVTALWLLTGCGEGFQSQTSSSSQSFQSTDGELNEYLNEIGARPYDESTGGLSEPTTDGGSTHELGGSRSGEVSSSGLVRFYADLNVPFDPIASALGSAHKSTKESMWEDCKAGSNVDTTKTYKCGEVPYGEVLDANTKRIMMVPYEGESGNENGIEYQVSATKVPVFLSRKQSLGKASVKSLDTKSLDPVDVGYNILDSVYFRLKPNAGTLETEICFFLPGLNIHTNTETVRVNAKKKVLWGAASLKANADAKIRIGEMSFDQAEFCGIFYAKTDSELKTHLSFQRMKAPDLKNLRFSGIQVSVDVQPKGLLKVISKILKLIGNNVEKKLEDRAREEIISAIEDRSIEVMSGDIASGKWFYKTLNANMMLKNLLPQIEEKINRSFKYLGPSSEYYLQSKFQSACEKIADDILNLENQNFEKLCKTNIRIKAHLFLKDERSAELGCYDHFFKPGIRDENQGKWWGRGCKIKNKIEIISSEEFAPLYSCIKDVYNSPVPEDYDLGSCQHELSILYNATRDLKIPTAILKETFESRIKNDPDYKKWAEIIANYGL